VSELGHRLEEALHDIEEHIPFYLRRWWRWSAIAVAAIVVPIALGLGLFRVIAPLVPGYTAQVEQRASALLGWPVAIDGMYLSWHGFGPEIVLQQVQLQDPSRGATLFTAEQVRVAVSPADFLRGGEWRPNRVLFQAPRVALTVTADQRVLVGGTVVGDLSAPGGDWRAALRRLLTHGRIEINDAEVFWHDQRRNDGPLGFAAAFLLDTDGTNHRLDLDLALPRALGRRLHVEAVADGAPEAPESWRWTGRLKGTALEVGWLHAWLNPDAAHGFTGTLDLDASTEAAGLRLETLDGRVSVAGLAAASAGAPAGGGIDALDSGIRWRRADAGWSLDLVRLTVRRGANTWQPGGLHLEYATDFVSPARLNGRAGFLRVEDLELVASWLPPDLLPLGPQLHALAPRGAISALEFGLQLEAGAVVDYEVTADFDALGFERQGKTPGIVGLKGKLRARRDGGTLTLDSRDLSFDFGDLFRGALALRSLRGELAWTRTPDGWFLQGSDLSLRNADARATAHFTLLLPGDGRAPVIDLEAKVNDAVAGNQRAYFPVRVMSPGLVAWLDRAIVAGRAPYAEFVLQGPLDRFPFRDGSGLFQVKFHAEDAVLDYGEGWPRIEGIVADVTFRNAGVEIVASRASIFGATSQQARAWIVDHADPVVHVEGRVAARAEQALEFLRASPLRTTLGDYLGALEVQGPVDFGLALAIVTHPGASEAFKAQIDANLVGARVALKGLPVVADEVAGTVRFTEATVTSERIVGRMFGQAFTARIAPPPKGARSLARLSLEGGFEARALARAVELPLDRFLRGQAKLSAEVDLPSARTSLVARMNTDLRGVAVTLPPPFAKAAAERVAARTTLQFSGKQALGAKVEYGSGSVASYALTRTPGGWTLADGEAAAQISVVAPVVDLDAWLAAWAAPAAPVAGRRATDKAAVDAPPLRRLDVHAQKLLLVGSPVNDAHITARRDGPTWQVEVASGAVAGSISVPDDRSAAAITLDMDRLWLGEPAAEQRAAANTVAPAAAGATQPKTVDPRTLPALQVRADSLRLLGSDLGAVEATLERRPTGLFMTRFVGKALTHRVEGTGSWEQVDAVQRSKLDVTLESTDARVTLTSLGWNAPLEARRARIAAQLDWPGAPWQDPFAHVSGAIQLRIGEGELIEIAPGAGRLVGLMSLSALPRRLKLDFRDVYKKGFAFDSVEGDFRLEDGNAYTSGARIKSPAATVTILGRAGLGARDYDQIAVVETGLGSSLPVAGAIAGGLPGAAVMLLVSQVFKSSLSDATKAQYRITGSWGDPKVERVQGKVVPPPAAKPVSP
jgi:uncharacterized protein (TIGR02099 family)